MGDVGNVCAYVRSCALFCSVIRCFGGFFFPFGIASGAGYGTLRLLATLSELVVERQLI